MKLTLRDLFWLVLVVAVCLSWCLDRGRLAAEVHRLESEAQSQTSRYQQALIKRVEQWRLEAEHIHHGS